MENLSMLKLGEKAIVINIDSDARIGRRLRDIGLISGTAVSCVGESPLGDPLAYLIRGAVIALRAEDSEGVHIARVEGA